MKKIKNLMLIVSCLSLIFMLGSVAFAEGSKDMMKYGGYRSYIQWDPTISVGNIPMTTKLSVYAKAGEKIYFGSSVSDRNDKKDIVVYDPSGTVYSYDVKSTSNSSYIGFINTVAKETAGPLPATGGYNPLSITVAQTGIWRFEFSAPQDSYAGQVPDYVLATAQFPTDEAQGAAVAAWDITVKDASNNIKNGRVFTNYLALNTGNNSVGSQVVMSKYNVLTKDGYIYEVSFNGADPFRYVFLSNNRGFIDKTNNTTLYHTPSTGAANDNLLDFITNSGNVAVQMPNVADTVTDITHKIFFNYPSTDLPASMPIVPVAPASVSEFKFTGTSGVDGEMGNNGEGGQFSFSLSTGASYQIIIDTNKDGSYQSGVDREISNIGLAGSNFAFWDGKDINGTTLTNLSQYNAKISIRGGEQHFPFLDSENNAYGIKIRLVNPPSIPAGYNPYTIYYDNSNFTTAKGTSINLDPKSGEVATSPRSALSGVDSTNGALAFNKNYGDKKGMNIWTYFPGDTKLCSFNIVEANVVKKGYLSGYVFLDNNTDALFNSGEPGLEGISVNITDKNGDVHTVLTDVSGHYIANILQGAYSVSVVPLSGYTLTTNNQTQSGTLSVAQFNLADVGYNLATDMQVTKSTNASTLNVGQNVIYTITAKNAGPAATTTVVVSDPLPAGLEYVSDTSGGSFEYQTGQWTIGNMAVNETKSINITAKITEAGTITNVATVSSSVNDSNSSNNTATHSITAVATPKYEIGNKVWIDANKNGILDNGEVGLANVIVNLYDVDNNLFNTTVTNSNGEYLFTNIAPASYSIQFSLINYSNQYKFTVKGNVSTNDNDSNADSLTGQTALFSLSANNYTIDAGVIALNAPVALDDSATTPVNTPVNISVLPNDSDLDGDTLTVTSATQGAHGTTTVNANGTIKYTPNSGYVGEDEFTYTISDGNGGTDTATVKVTIANDAPVALDDSATTPVNTPVNISVLPNDSDPNGDTLTVTSATQGAHGTTTVNADGTIKYTPNSGYVGEDEFTYTISDGNGGTDTATVKVTISPRYEIGNKVWVDTNKNGLLDNAEVGLADIIVNLYDENNQLTKVASTDNSGEYIFKNVEPGKYSVQFNLMNYSSQYKFTIQGNTVATDNDSNADPITGQTLLFNLLGNDYTIDAGLITFSSPVASDDTASTSKNTPVNINVLANDSDPDGDTLTITDVTQGAHGSVSINPNGTIKYTPDNNYTGKDEFTYTISDGNGGTDTATVTVNVSSVNNPPVALDDSTSTPKNTPVNIDVILNDSDPDDDIIEIISVNNGSHGTASINTDGTIKYTPANGYSGKDTFTYTISDGNGGTDTATVTVNINSSNNSPVAEDDEDTTPKNTSVNISVLPNDSDEDDDTLTVISVSQGSHGSTSINANGTIRYTPNTGYVGEDTFTYTISDCNGGTDTATVTVTITDPNIDDIDDVDCDEILGDPSDPIFDTTQYSIFNFAGTGIGGFNGQKGTSTPNTYSPATNGEVYGPRGITVDKYGKVYIADEMNGNVRKITIKNGNTTMSTIVGNGIENGYTPTSYTGPAYGSAMYEPMDVVVSPCGKYVFFLDTDSHIVRMIDDKGNLKTIAGVYEIGSAGSYSTGNGDPLKAKLNTPQGIAIDKTGNLYISDTNNNVIRKISLKEHTISTIAGTPTIGGFSGDGGQATSATLNKPMGIALDSDGNLLFADVFNHRVRKINLTTGIITTVVGSGQLPANSGTAEGVKDGGDAKDASLFFPHDIAIDAADNIYIADSANHRIRKVIKATNIIITIAGDGNIGNTGIGGDASTAKLNWPKGVAVDGNGVVYISDTLNHTIKKLVP